MTPKRIWYRSRTTGDRGYIFQDGDKTKIRLDRPNDDVTRTFVAGEWIEEEEVRNFTPMQLAQVAYAADRQLCSFLGLHTEAKKEWLSLREEPRIQFMKKGPQGSQSSEIRQDLYQAIMDVLQRYC